MAQNELLLKLTADQQKQIKDATGKSVSELKIALSAAGGELTERDLDKAVGGDDESPKETVTFEYGALNIKYAQQKPD